MLDRIIAFALRNRGLVCVAALLAFVVATPATGGQSGDKCQIKRGFLHRDISRPKLGASVS